MNLVKQQKQLRGLSEINLTSLVDVSLTLVIIFMVSYPLVMQSGINVFTPSLEKARTVLEETELKAEINILSDSRIELNGHVIAPELLADSLRTLLGASKDKLVVVSAEGEVIHDQVVAVLDLAKECGARQLALVKRR